MVVASVPIIIRKTEKSSNIDADDDDDQVIIIHDEFPTINLSGSGEEVGNLIVKACEEYGFFKVIDHGVPDNIISEMEEAALEFFAKPVAEKQRAANNPPFGYGCKNIGLNGDTGELEYLLLQTDPVSISHTSISISNTPNTFRTVTTAYIEAAKELASHLLELMAQGLGLTDVSVWSRMIRDVNSDSVFRLNHYPPTDLLTKGDHHHHHVGFGEHTDPQILTLLRSNDVSGLQICVQNGMWVPVPPDPTAFFVNVGDVLQAMTNGRFLSVRHRAMTNTSRPRMSMAYFGAPPPNTWIKPLPEMLPPETTCPYRPFTWAEYKNSAYSMRLGDGRLEFFKEVASA